MKALVKKIAMKGYHGVRYEVIFQGRTYEGRMEFAPPWAQDLISQAESTGQLKISLDELPFAASGYLIKTVVFAPLFLNSFSAGLE